jgi:hypothetical protein
MKYFTLFAIVALLIDAITFRCSSIESTARPITSGHVCKCIECNFNERLDTTKLIDTQALQSQTLPLCSKTNRHSYNQ